MTSLRARPSIEIRSRVAKSARVISLITGTVAFGLLSWLWLSDTPYWTEFSAVLTFGLALYASRNGGLYQFSPEINSDSSPGFASRKSMWTHAFRVALLATSGNLIGSQLIELLSTERLDGQSFITLIILGTAVFIAYLSHELGGHVTNRAFGPAGDGETLIGKRNTARSKLDELHVILGFSHTFVLILVYMLVLTYRSKNHSRDVIRIWFEKDASGKFADHLIDSMRVAHRNKHFAFLLLMVVTWTVFLGISEFRYGFEYLITAAWTATVLLSAWRLFIAEPDDTLTRYAWLASASFSVLVAALGLTLYWQQLPIYYQLIELIRNMLDSDSQTGRVVQWASLLAALRGFTFMVIPMLFMSLVLIIWLEMIHTRAVVERVGFRSLAMMRAVDQSFIILSLGAAGSWIIVVAFPIWGEINDRGWIALVLLTATTFVIAILSTTYLNKRSIDAAIDWMAGFGTESVMRSPSDHASFKRTRRAATSFVYVAMVISLLGVVVSSVVLSVRIADRQSRFNDQLAELKQRRPSTSYEQFVQHTDFDALAAMGTLHEALFRSIDETGLVDYSRVQSVLDEIQERPDIEPVTSVVNVLRELPGSGHEELSSIIESQSGVITLAVVSHLVQRYFGPDYLLSSIPTEN